MIITSEMAKARYTNITNKNTKLSRDVRDGKLIKIKNGLYETDPNTSGHLLAGCIYGPSYLSFDFALEYYGLIPERVVNYTCATFRKKKKKKYTNHFGTFFYRDVPSEAYPLGIKIVEENNYSYQIATREKALCDKLYTLNPLHNLEELEYMLFDDLRIDEEEFEELDYTKVEKLAPLYHSTNVDLLAKYMRRRNNRE